MVYSLDKLGNKKPLTEEEKAIKFAKKEEATCECEEKKLLLFTTKTCPKCRMAKMFLDNAGIKYEALLAEDNADLVKLYGVTEAPTLIVLAGDSFDRIANPSNIKAFSEKA